MSKAAKFDEFLSSNNINCFSKEEIELLISVLKEYSSEEEMQKMNKVLAMFQM